MSGYIGSTPVPQATQHRESFTATEGQTSFATAGYTPQFVDVYLNGSHLSPADFTASNGSDVVLGVAASADDVCDIISYTPFEIADQTFTGTTTMDVSLTTGVLTANGGAVFNDGSADVDFRIESNGNANMLFVDGGDNAVVIGHNASRKTLFNTTATGALQVEGTTGNTSTLSIARNSNDDNGPQLVLAKSNGTAGAAVTVVTDAALLGRMSFQGADGTQTVEAARVEAFVDGTPGANDMPGRLVFSTTADGASTVTERMRIDSLGNVAIGIVPSAVTDSSVTANLQLGATFITHFDTDAKGTSVFANNKFWDGSNNKALFVGEASEIQMNSGVIKFRNAASVSAGANNTMVERMRLDASGNLFVGKAASNLTNSGVEIFPADGGGVYITNKSTNTAERVLLINRQSGDGELIEFKQANTKEGTITVSGNTVALNGFSGRHESSGIPTNTERGTVVSTIDELDVYPQTQNGVGSTTEDCPKAGQNRRDHAKVKVSDAVGDACVYGVVAQFTPQDKVIVTSLGIGSVRVTGACSKGDLLESNGDGTAKVQSDDIVRSKTQGKVTISNSNTGVKLVSCVMYCG